jgi:hypothetical protein
MALFRGEIFLMTYIVLGMKDQEFCADFKNVKMHLSLIDPLSQKVKICKLFVKKKFGCPNFSF